MTTVIDRQSQDRCEGPGIFAGYQIERSYRLQPWYRPFQHPTTQSLQEARKLARERALKGYPAIVRAHYRHCMIVDTPVESVSTIGRIVNLRPTN